MGIATTTEHLAQAAISAIHYSKNIPLTDGSTPYHYINKIKEANINLSLDVNQTDYRNEGHSYRWHCNSYKVVFYDKIRQLYNRLGIKATLTFKKLFKPTISKKVLLHYMSELESKRPFILDYQVADDKEFLSALIINNPELSLKRIVELYGLKKALKVVTLHELKTMLNVGK